MFGLLLHLQMCTAVAAMMVLLMVIAGSMAVARAVRAWAIAAVALLGDDGIHVSPASWAGWSDLLLVLHHLHV